MDDEKERREQKIREDFEEAANKYIADAISDRAGFHVDHPEDFYRLQDRKVAILRRRCWVCRLHAAAMAHLLRLARWWAPFCARHVNRPRMLAVVAVLVTAWTYAIQVVRWMPCVEGCRPKPPDAGGDEREE